MDYFGVGGHVDKAAGVHWFETGARLHDPQSAYDLAVLSCEADNGQRDLRRASELLRFSASKGYVAGKHALGLLLVNHPELAESENEARVALKEASDAGNWKSSAILGVLARDGKAGVAPDPSRAYYFFRLAAMQGGKENQQLVAPDLALLEKKLAAAQQETLTAEAEAQFQKSPTPMVFVLNDGAPGGGFPLVAATDIGPRP
jgi:TPR repeat protein